MNELSRAGTLDYEFVDEARSLGRLGPTLAGRVLRRLSRGRPLAYRAFNRALVETAAAFKPELVVVVKGASVAPQSLEEMRKMGDPFLVNFMTDDPFNARVSRPSLIGCLPHYDLVASPRKAGIADIERVSGAKTRYVRFAYKPSVHFLEEPPSPLRRRFASDVVFIGTLDPDRVPYFEALIRLLPGLNLHLYGGGWDRVASLRALHKGMALGRDFRHAVAGAKIAVNFVRRSNRDDHSMRTFEIPACGGFMLAERTPEHEALLVEGRDAAFFGGVDDFVAKVTYFMDRTEDRARIAELGTAWVRSGQNTYSDRLQEILDLVEEIRSGSAGK